MKHGFAQLIMGVIGIVIAIILLSSALMPVIIGVNQTVWVDPTNTSKGMVSTIPTSAWAMWGVLPIVVIAGLIVLIVNAFM
jgi:hypothetical protein